jgi:hypothetical protein
MNIIDPDDPTIQKSQIRWAPRGAFFLETTHGPSFSRPSGCTPLQRKGPRRNALPAPPMKDRKRCRIHGALSPGAPRGSENVDGYWTREAVEERRFIRLLLKGTLGGRS